MHNFAYIKLLNYFPNYYPVDDPIMGLIRFPIHFTMQTGSINEKSLSQDCDRLFIFLIHYKRMMLFLTTSGVVSSATNIRLIMNCSFSLNFVCKEKCFVIMMQLFFRF
ncbi:hypothetical protein D7D25_03905 [Proteiniphilum sp. X52]|nr:hypothetical protein D7D25_03905 [Proteiniphilum sp. X52]